MCSRAETKAKSKNDIGVTFCLSPNVGYKLYIKAKIYQLEMSEPKVQFLTNLSPIQGVWL